VGNLDRRLKEFEKASDYDYIVLRDGSRFWFGRKELYKSFFLYRLACITPDYRGEERQPVPDIFLAIADAKDREEAMDKVCPRWRGWRTDNSISAAIDLDVLVEEGLIEPYSEVELVFANASEEERREYDQLHGRASTAEVEEDG